jgi:hypothetical protein
MKRIILPKEQYDTVRSLYNDIFVILRDTPEVEEALLKVDAAVLSFMFGEGKNMLRGYAVSEDLDAYVDKIASPKQLLDQLELELGFIFDPEQREMVAGLYGDIKEALASTSDASEALVEVHDAVLAFVQVIEEEARNGPADQETGSYAAGDLINTSAFGVLKSYLAQRGPAFDLLSKLEMALENSTVIESYADRLSDAEGRGGAAVAAEWEDIGREARVLARVHTISVLLDEGDIEKIRKEIEITVKSCRDILGEEPYPEGWFDEALNMIQAYAWGRAFSGSNYENLDEARAIYREMLNEPYQIAIPAGQTNDLLTIIRNKENAGNIRRAMSAGSEYEWKTWMQYGDMLLALYYHEKQKQKARLAAEGVAEEELEDKALEAIGSNQIIINALAEAYFAFDVADQIRPDDGRAGSKMTDVADLCRELGFEIEDYRDDWAFRRRPEESEE